MVLTALMTGAVSAFAADIPELPVPFTWPVMGGLGEIDYDLSAPTDRQGMGVIRMYAGTPVVASHAGEVTLAGMDPDAPNLGFCVVIENAAAGVRTRYSHLQSPDGGVGDFVDAGDRIGWIGGQEPGWPEDALGFELWIGTVKTNPLWYLVDDTSAASE